jgi:hypothetical protein
VIRILSHPSLQFDENKIILDTNGGPVAN